MHIVQNKYGKCRMTGTSCTSTSTPSSTITTHTTSTTCTTIKLVTFKPDYSGKPEEDAEAHLLRANDWRDTHQFQEGV